MISIQTLYFLFLSWLILKENRAQNENIQVVVDQLAELQAELEVDQSAEPIPSQDETLYLDLLPQADEASLVMIVFQDHALPPLEDHPGHLNKNKNHKMEMLFIAEDSHTERSHPKEVNILQHLKSHFKSKILWHSI